MKPVEITPEAAAKFREYLKDEPGKKGIRVGVIGGGCSGLQYTLDYYQSASETDHEYEQWGLMVCVDEFSALHLQGTVIEFEDTITSQGFKFDNPNASRKCGCGQSFETA